MDVINIHVRSNVLFMSKSNYYNWASTRENLSSEVFWTTQAQTSLRIRAVLSAPLLYAYWKVSYLA